MNTTTKTHRCFLNVREHVEEVEMITTYVFNGYNGLAAALSLKFALASEGIYSKISTQVDEVFTNPKLN